MSDRLEALLEAARAAEQPPADVADSTWANIDARVQAGAGPSVPVDVRGLPGFSKATLPLLAKIGLVATVAGTIAIGLVRAGSGQAPAQLHGGSLAGIVAPKAPPPVVQPPPPPASPQPAVEPAPEVETSAPEPPPPARSRPKPKPAPAPAASRLSEETALLRRAWRALDQGRSVQAATVVATHEREFPRGALIEEREAVRAVLACKRDASAADRVASRFAKRFPKSVHRARVRSACGDREK